ncbi:hypothetical protein VMCG_03462 [Cytospora schulzeri]|uniref:Cytochrome P450 n=1 Tax=Cytospora schulzeri TaxID=448051 RepID=A0A423WWL0_9PEZI|nr:hypothetical protein VMCG_03462 [Valsa malicola]
MINTALLNKAVPAFACLLVISWFIRKLYPKPYPGIPYNKRSANRITGDIPDLVPLLKATNEFSDPLFTVTTQKLGTPIAQFLFPGIRRPFIVLEDPREIEDILMRRNKEFDVAPMAVEMYGPMFPYAMVAQYSTPELKAQKRLWADAVKSEFLRATAAPNVHKATLELLHLWRLRASQQTQPFYILDDLKNSALDAIWVSAVGENPGMVQYEIEKLKRQTAGGSSPDGRPQAEPLGAFIKREVTYIAENISRNSNSISPKLAQIWESYTPRFRRCRTTVQAEVGRALAKAVERFQGLDSEALEAKDTCMMDLVLRRQMHDAARTGGTPKDPTKDLRMCDTLFTMLVAGYDSTANTLSWFAKFMETNQHVQSELRSTLRAAFSDSMPSVDEILGTEVPYLDGTCEETLRLAGTAKAQLRQAVVDTEILGCRVPKGAQVFLNLHINRAPHPVDELKRSASSQTAGAKLGDGLQTYASRDVAAFEPRRWLTKDGKTGRDIFNPYAMPSLAFGGGLRGCPGRKLAEMEIRIAIVLIILNFEFLPLPDELRTTTAAERIFRRPDTPYARLKILC